MRNGGSAPLTAGAARLRDLVVELDQAASDLGVVLTGVRQACRRWVDGLDSGVPVREIHTASEAAQVRDGLTAALVRVNEAMRACRAEATRVMVDEDGLTITEAARLTGRSRQFVSRLLEDGRRKNGHA